jgi:bacterioferritin-associated ferredoxin
VVWVEQKLCRDLARRHGPVEHNVAAVLKAIAEATANFGCRADCGQCV